MRLLTALWILTSLAGCDLVFHLDEVRAGASDARADGASACMGTPRQQVNALETASNSLVFTVQPTEPGSTLVLVAAIATTTYNLASVIDDGGNTWHQVATVQTPSTTPAALDIWYAATTAPASSITATLSSGALRSMAVSLTEWPCMMPMAFDGAASTPGTTSSDASSGKLTTAGRDLVIGAVVFSDVGTTATFAGATGFAELSRFGTSNQVSARAAYAWAPPGTYELPWTLSPPATWVGGILALKAP